MGAFEMTRRKRWRTSRRGAWLCACALAVAITTALALVAIVLRGSPGVDVKAAVPGEENGSSGAVGANGKCMEVAEFPNLPVWELNAELPILNVADSFVRAELQLRRGSGSCPRVSRGPILADNCAVVRGDNESIRDVILWHDADQFAAAAFGEGATDLVTEDVTGHSGNDGQFLYRMTAVRYADIAAVNRSFVVSDLEDCGSEAAGIGQIRGQVLREGSEPYAFAFREGFAVFLVEVRLAVDASGKPVAIPDTPSGLLPDSAVARISSWWRYEAGRLLGVNSRTTGRSV